MGETCASCKPFITEEDGVLKVRTCAWSPPGDHPVGCGMFIHVKDGKIVKVEGDPSHPITQGRLCPRCIALDEVVYHKDRLLSPMKRAREDRGKDTWERITWDEAVRLIVDQWKRTEADFGPLANTYYQGGGGAQGSLNGNAGLIMRLFNALGCTKWDYSFDNATNTGLTRGGIQWFDQSEPQDFVNSDYILFLGGNPVGAQIQMWQHLANAQEAGAKIVCVDPLFSPTVAKADKWIPVKPGCDAALYLGIIKRFMDEGTYNADFVLNHTCAPFLIKKSDGMYLRGGEYCDEPLHVGPPFWVTGQPTEIDPIMVWNEQTGQPDFFDTCESPSWSCPDDDYVTAWDMFKEHVQEWTLDRVMEVTGISEEDFDYLYDVLQPEHKVAHYINFGTGAYENGLQAA